MQRRRTLVAAVLVLALPLLAGCGLRGFSRATDRPYTAGPGVDSRTGTVDVLSAVIVAAQPDSGTFIASLANKSPSKSAVFESLAGAGNDPIVATKITPLRLTPRGFANLADTGGVVVSGSFGVGDVIPVTLSFASGETVSLDVPVVYACQEYTGLDDSDSSSSSSSESPSSSPSSSGAFTGSPIPASTAATPSASSSATPSGSATTSVAPTESSSSSPSASTTPYTCGSNTSGE